MRGFHICFLNLGWERVVLHLIYINCTELRNFMYGGVRIRVIYLHCCRKLFGIVSELGIGVVLLGIGLVEGWTIEVVQLLLGGFLS